MSNTIREVLIKDEKNIKIHGRTVENRDPVTLVWTGSCIEMNVKCSELSILLAGPYENYENWIAIEINGAVLARHMIKKKKTWVKVFRGLNPAVVTNVKIIKEVQAMHEDVEHCLKAYAVKLDGEILPVEERPYKLEFIGDSITSGEGAFGAKQEEEWISMFFGHVHSYPYMVSKELNADYRVFSKSGWGIYCSWDNQPKFNIPSQYENICSATFSEKLAKKGFCKKNDFASWQPDAILVNLGTNDDGAFHNPAFTDENGVTHKMRMKGDKYLKKDGDKVKNAAVEFLKILRRNNENARIFWCYGMLGDGMKEILLAAIKEYKEETKDKKVAFLELPNTTEETVGSRMHPGKASHEKAAKVIVKKLKSVL